MAEETSTAPVADVPAPGASASATATDAPETNGGTIITKNDEETASKQATTEVIAPDGLITEAAVGPSAEGTEGTPASGKKEKRKSTSGVPEHKVKKLTKKKSTVNLQLECKPGDFYWARLKGYPPWPSIICDEQMLPESLLATRPVSTMRADGTLRDDFKEGGKNAKERTFPVMFLSTNEFSWMINTSLAPLDPEECKTQPKGKMTKALTHAYQLASEKHDLDYYKGLLKQWQEDEKAIAEELRKREAEEARKAEEKAEKDAAAVGADDDESKDKKKKKARKSKGADEDVEMDDAGEAPKSSKKRKKEGESDAEGTKAKKTPKVTKLNAPKTPDGETASSKKSRPKKKVTAPKPEEGEEDAKPQMTEAERQQQREKAVLYLRHRLQKGFLTRDQAPQESEMAAMADFFTQLESYDNLDPEIIKVTKIHKVLKAIVKLSSIPKDEEFNFKKRSAGLLENWNKVLLPSDGDAVATRQSTAAEEETTKVPETNGEAKPEPTATTNGTTAAAEEAADEIEEKTAGVAETTEGSKDIPEPPEAPVEQKVPGNEAQDEATDGDVSMQTAPAAEAT